MVGSLACYHWPNWSPQSSLSCNSAYKISKCFGHNSFKIELQNPISWSISKCHCLSVDITWLSQNFKAKNKNSMKHVNRLHSLCWSIHTKNESNRGTAFAFIFGVNWLWSCGVTASFGVFFCEMKCNGMIHFMEFMQCW